MPLEERHRPHVLLDQVLGVPPGDEREQQHQVDLVRELHRRSGKQHDREVASAVVGALVTDRLRRVDQVAYVRFASVYRRFQEATDFVHAVRKLEEQT